MVVAAREREFGRKLRTGIVLETVGSYRRAMASFATMGELAVWYAHADLAELGARLADRLSKNRRHRPQGGRDRQRRDPVLDRPDGGPRRQRPAAPPGQGGTANGARRPRR
jgi:hypothetical protein